MRLWLIVMLAGISTFLAAEQYVIVVPEDAIPAEMTAASELKNEIRKICKADLPIVHEKGESPAILIGQSARTAKLTGVDFSKLKPDEIILKRIGSDLVVTGQRPRGSLYAVYELLERYYGVRYWTDSASYYPQQDAFVLPDQVDFRYAPPFRYRQMHSDILRDCPKFAVKLRDNGTSGIPPQWGGAMLKAGEIHSFDILLPPQKYFAAHPDWYAEVDGKRKSQNAQLCLSNPDCRNELVKASLEYLRQHPQQQWLNLSQNDNRNYCRCPQCNAFVAKNGNQTDLLMMAINQVASAVSKEFPQVTIRTLAYEYTRQPPRTIRPFSNVMVQYCDHEANLGKPLTSPVNAMVAQEIIRWQKLSAQLYIWHYVINYSNYLLPFPNWEALGPDMRFFAAHGIDGIFSQGPFYAGHVGFSDLRVWLTCRLMWNPQQDTDQLIAEFVHGYYGPAAPEILQYLHIINAAMKDSPAKLSWFMSSPRPWLPESRAVEAFQVMQAACRKAANDPEFLQRVEAAAIPITIAAFDYPSLMQGKDYDRVIEHIIDVSRKNGATRAGESVSFDDLKRKLLFGKFLQYTGKPDFVGNRSWVGVSALQGAVYPTNKWVFPDNDPQAFEKKALRIPYNDNWVVQLYYPRDGVYEVYAAVRCDAGNPSGAAFRFGMYSPATQKTSHVINIPAKKIAGDKYTYVKIGDFSGANGEYIFLQPINNPSVKNIWLDRFILIDK